MYVCPTCSTTLKSQHGLAYHINNNVCAKANICQKCKQHFTTRKNYQYHLSHNVCEKRKTTTTSPHENMSRQELIDELVKTKEELIETKDGNIKTKEELIEKKDRIDKISDHISQPNKCINRILKQLGRIGGPYREKIFTQFQCSGTVSQKLNNIVTSLENTPNPLVEYVSSEHADMNSLYILLLLDEKLLDSLYIKAMKTIPDSNCGIYHKIIAIIKNYGQMSKSKNGKTIIASKLRREVWDKYMGNIAHGRCYCCGHNEIMCDKFEAGHIVPDNKDGPTTIENLRPICQECNQQMGQMDMHEFAKQFGCNSRLISEAIN